MKKKTVIIDKITKKGRTKPEGVKIEVEVNLRNDLHFEVQRNTRSNVFVNRKKRAKNGYSKYKNRIED